MPTFYVGIDVSKFKHTCSVLSKKGEVIIKSFDFANSREGFQILEGTLNDVGPPENMRIMMEATGHYHENLFRFLITQGFASQIKNPTVIARFKDAEDVGKAKTDRLDAMLIARYAIKHDFNPSPSKLYNIERIRRLSRAKNSLHQTRTKTINLLHRYLDETFPELIPFFKTRENGEKRYLGRNFFDSPTMVWLVRKFPSAAKFANARIETAEKLRRMSKGAFSLIKFNKLREIAKNSIGTSFLETELIITQLIEQFLMIKEQEKMLDKHLEPLIDETAPELITIPGIGYRLAGLIIGEIGDITNFPNPYKLIKFAGLDVRVYQSGTIEKRGKLRKRGSPLLRYALFQAAEKSRIHSPEFAEFYAKKRNEGKHWICALTHTSRKMLRTIWAILTKKENYRFPLNH